MIPGVRGVRQSNHNETVVRDTGVEKALMEIEELEAKIAPTAMIPGVRGVRANNHNETFVRDTNAHTARLTIFRGRTSA
jgi:hypothetical protein